MMAIALLLDAPMLITTAPIMASMHFWPKYLPRPQGRRRGGGLGGRGSVAGG